MLNFPWIAIAEFGFAADVREIRSDIYILPWHGFYRSLVAREALPDRQWMLAAASTQTIERPLVAHH